VNDDDLLRWMVDLALAVSVAELLVRTWRAPAPLAVAVHLLAGLGLMLALRLQLAQAGLVPVAACLAGAGLAHAIDARRRSLSARDTSRAPVIPTEAAPRREGSS
jgi:hypothetical protein